VIAIALHGDYAVVLDSAGMAPSELVEKIKLETKGGTNDSACTPCAQNGSDGFGSLTCINLIVVFLPKHIAKHHLATFDSLQVNGQLGKSYCLSA
jgi:hypothetical protein